MEDNKKSPIIERLTQFIEYTGLTNSQFADKAEIPRPSLSQMFHGRNKSLNNHVLGKLNAAFPNLNIVWLLFGSGNMLNDPNIAFSDPQINFKSTSAPKQEFENEENASSNSAQDMGLFSEQNRFSGENEAQAPSSTPPLDAFKPTVNTASKTVEPTGIDTISQIMPSRRDDTKQIKSIIVFYTDNSFETFLPNQD